MNEKSHILIVDDEPKNIQLAATLLGDIPEFELFFATGGKQALQLADTNQFDLILLDIMMPEVDGYEVCKALKASDKNREIPVIFVTAKADPESIAHGFQLGSVDYVSKPFNGTELIARVRTHLALYHAQHALERKIGDLVDESRKKAKNILQTRIKIQEQHQQQLHGYQADIDALTKVILEKDEVLERFAALEKGYNALKKSYTDATIRLKEKSGRSALLAELERELGRSQDFTLPFTVAAFGIDNFSLAQKSMDKDNIRLLLMQPIRDLIQEELRSYDVLVTTEKGSFFVLMTAKLDDAKAIVKEIQERIFGLHRNIEGFVLSLSVGITASLPSDKSDTLLIRAEGVLEEALKGGRNSLVVRDAGGKS